MTDTHDNGRIVSAFLRATERGDLDAAQAMVAPSITYVFPAMAPATDLVAVMADIGKTYKSVAKDFEAIEVYAKDNSATVYVRGTLGGEWADGTAFAGIRFIDRFELVDGIIVSQKVWNDAGDALLQRAAAR